MENVKLIIKKHSPFKKRSATIRYMFPAVATFAALLGAAVIGSSASSFVRLESSVSTVEAGQRFTLQVYANAHVPVNAVDITLAFDKDVVQVIEVDRGQSVLTLWTEDPIIKENSVILRGGTFKKGFLGEHLVASIDLQAVSTGKGSFSATDVLFLAGDGTGSTVSVAKSNKSTVSFFIYDENTDPSEIAMNVKVKVVTDVNGDGKVTLADISAFMAAWSNQDQTYDFNSDGKMTFRDFSIILADYFFN